MHDYFRSIMTYVEMVIYFVVSFITHISQILQELEEKLLINLKIWSFTKKDIVYLNFFISIDGLNMDPKKVKGILD